MLDLTQTKFFKSAASMGDLPQSIKEVAFAGSSNAGKSSAINKITGIKKLAKTSNTPGRTQLINYFSTSEENLFLVDLPGYGYAKVSKETKKKWDLLLDSYLNKRSEIVGMFLIMDIRHAIKPNDKLFVEWANHYNIRLHVILSKSDKLSKSQSIQILNRIKKELKAFPSCSCQLFSSPKNIGVEEAQNILLEMFE